MSIIRRALSDSKENEKRLVRTYGAASAVKDYGMTKLGGCQQFPGQSRSRCSSAAAGCRRWRLRRFSLGLTEREFRLSSWKPAIVFSGSDLATLAPTYSVHLAKRGRGRKLLGCSVPDGSGVPQCHRCDGYADALGETLLSRLHAVRCNPMESAAAHLKIRVSKNQASADGVCHHTIQQIYSVSSVWIHSSARHSRAREPKRARTDCCAP